MKKAIVLLSMLLLSFHLIQAHAADLSNKGHGWGFVKSKNGVPADAGEMLNELVKKHQAIYKGNPADKVLYITFDNGYENGYTGQFLDVLKKHEVPGIFFVTGHYLKTAPELAKRMVEEGHLIGNHSWSHPDMTTLSEDEIKEELNQVAIETEKITGQKGMQYLRPPRGIFSERTMNIANRHGYLHIFWSIAYKDWDTKNQKGAQYAYEQIMKQAHPGGIMLIHTVSKDNADALDRVITDLKKQGYRFESLDDLIMERELGNGIL